MRVHVSYVCKHASIELDAKSHFLTPRVSVYYLAISIYLCRIFSNINSDQTNTKCFLRQKNIYCRTFVEQFALIYAKLVAFVWLTWIEAIEWCFSIVNHGRMQFDTVPNQTNSNKIIRNWCRPVSTEIRMSQKCATFFSLCSDCDGFGMRSDCDGICGHIYFGMLFRSSVLSFFTVCVYRLDRFAYCVVVKQ